MGLVGTADSIRSTTTYSIFPNSFDIGMVGHRYGANWSSITGAMMELNGHACPLMAMLGTAGSFGVS